MIMQDGAITAMETRGEFIVTADIDNLVNVCRYANKSIALLASKKMPSTVTSLKVVDMDNRPCLMVVRKRCMSFEYYSLESLTLIKSVAFNNSDYGPLSFAQVQIELDETRTRYLIAAIDTPHLRIISGVVGSSSSTSSIVEGVSQNATSVPTLAWSNESPFVWLAGVDEFVRQVRISDGTVVRKLDGEMELVKQVIVTTEGDKEVVVGIGERDICTWKFK